MKKLLIAMSLALVSNFSHAGIVLKDCGYGQLMADPSQKGGVAIVAENGTSVCRDQNGQYYKVNFSQVGAALQLVYGDFRIDCTSSNPSGTYAFASASCTVGIGCQVKAAISYDKACVLTGVNIGVGADLSVGVLTIQKHYLD